LYPIGLAAMQMQPMSTRRHDQQNWHAVPLDATYFHQPCHTLFVRHYQLSQQYVISRIIPHLASAESRTVDEIVVRRLL